MAKPWRDIPILGRKTWRDIADGAVRAIKKLTDSGRGVDGAFPAYVASYLKRKTAGKFKRQASQSATPDLKLTGDMMRDLKTVSANDTSAVIAWPAHGQKVRWNAESGRAISTPEKPVADEVGKYVLFEVDSAVEKNIKAARTSQTYRFGK